MALPCRERAGAPPLKCLARCRSAQSRVRGGLPASVAVKAEPHPAVRRLQSVPPLLRRTLDIGATLRRIWHGRDSFLFAAGFVLPRAMSLLTIPVYTRLLGPADFGRYEFLTSIFSLLYVVCLLGMDFALSVRFFGLDDAERRRDATAAVAVSGTASIVATLVLVAIAGALGPLILQSSEGALPFAITVAVLPFNVLGGVLAMCLRLRFRGRAFFAAMVGGAVGGAVSGVLLVIALRMGLVGALAGFALIHILTFGLLLANSRGLFIATWRDRDRAILLARLGAPLVPAGASSWVFAVADRFFVSAFVGFTQLGLYAAAARLGTILVLIQFGFHATWGPAALRWGTAPDRDRRYAASLRVVAVGGGALVALVSWLAYPLLWILAGPSYVAAVDAVWLLAASALYLALFYIVQIGASLAQRGDRVAWATIAAAVANTVANVALIPPFGYMGAAWATLIAYALAYLIMYRMSQGLGRIRLGFRKSTAWASGWTVVAWASTVSPASLWPVLVVIVTLAASAAMLTAVGDAARILTLPIPAAVDAAERDQLSPEGGPA
jgi:O-antigen/teichoic acid export membrane protein